MLAFAAAGVFVAAPPVLAQAPQQRPDVLMEQQRKMDEQQKKLEQETKPKAPPQIDKPSRTRPPKGGEAKVKVTQFKFSGNTVIRTKDLDKIVEPSVGKVLTLHELSDVAGDRKSVV